MTTKNDAKTVTTASVNTLAENATEIVVQVLNGLAPRLRTKIAASLDGARLVIVLQVHPTFSCVVALEGSDPRAAPISLARWTGDAPSDIARHLN